MNKKELEDCAGKMNLKALHIYWGAKEAIYKFYGLKTTNIKTDIYILPFEISKSGKLIGKFKNEKVVNLNYEVTEEYVLVYTS
jgi:homoserine trans-succinylase